MAELQSFAKAFALSVSMLGAEHMFSANMSSPWSVATFAKSQTDVDRVWRLYKESAVISFISAGVIGWLLLPVDKDAMTYALLGTAVITGWMYYDYSHALDGTL